MNIAIDSFSFHLHMGKHWYTPSKKYSLAWYCRKSCDLGVQGLHLDPAHYAVDSDMDFLREYCLEHGLYCELGGFGTHIDELRPYIKAAETLGSTVVRTFLGGSWQEGRGVIRERVDKAVMDLKESAAYAADKGVVVAVENHGDITLEDMLRLMDNTGPGLGVCYDSGNFFTVGDDPLAALDTLKDRVVCTHLKDVCLPEMYPDAKPFASPDQGFHFCALGNGFLPLADICSLIRTSGIERLTIEIHSPFRQGLSEQELLDFEMENVKESLAYLKAIQIIE